MARPVTVGTPTQIAATGSTGNASHTVDANAEILIIDSIGFRNSNPIARPTVTSSGHTVIFEDEIQDTLLSTDDRHCGRWFVDGPSSGATTVTVTYAAATNFTACAYDVDTVGDSSAPFDDTVTDESTGTSASITTNSTTDDLVVASFGYYNVTLSIDDGGTQIQLDDNGSSAVSRSTHELDGVSTSTTAQVSFSSAKWLGISSTIGGTGGGGGGVTGSPWYYYANQR